jgi:hypothetical protein
VLHASAEFEEYMQRNPQSPGRGSLTGRTVLEGKIVHIPDVKADPEYRLTKAIRLGQYRTMLGVPLMREGAPIGVFTLTRSRVTEAITPLRHYTARYTRVAVGIITKIESPLDLLSQPPRKKAGKAERSRKQVQPPA